LAPRILENVFASALFLNNQRCLLFVFVVSVFFCILGQAEAENSSLLGCYTVSTGKSLQTFRRS